MAGFNYAQNIMGLDKKIDLKTSQLSASKIGFSDPDFSADNTKEAIKEVDLKIDDLSASKIPFTATDFTADNVKDGIIEAKASGGESNFTILPVSVAVNTSIRSDWHENFNTGVSVPVGYSLGGFAVGNIPNTNGHTPVGKCYVSDGYVYITLCNSTGYGETVSGDITGALIFFKN